MKNLSLFCSVLYYISRSILGKSTCFHSMNIYLFLYLGFLYFLLALFLVFIVWVLPICFFRLLFIYLFVERGEGREKERERNMDVWLPLARPLLGTWPTSQACALTGNRTGEPLDRGPALNPLSHTSQGRFVLITIIMIYLSLFGYKAQIHRY